MFITSIIYRKKRKEEINAPSGIYSELLYFLSFDEFYLERRDGKKVLDT
jgi:hypothetical protein